MAKLCDLASCFMEAFLKTNPNSLVDSNGYLRSEYEAELARRAAHAAYVHPVGVPDPSTYCRPQFECIGEVAPVFESPEAQLGIADIKRLGDEGYLTQEQVEAILTASCNRTGQHRCAQCDQQTEARNDEAPVIEDCAVRPVEPVEYVDTTAYELYTHDLGWKDVNLAAEPETQASNLTTEAPPDVITVAEPSDSEQ